MSGLETDGELPTPMMSTTTMTVHKQTQPQSAEQHKIVCRFCKKPAHVMKECRKRIRKEQKLYGEKQTTKKANAQTFPLCTHYQRTNYRTDLCRNGSNSANTPKRFRTENANHSTEDIHKPGTSTRNAPTPILKHLPNYKRHESTGHIS